MAETRLTPELDLEGMSPEEAFAVLGDETRLDIIRVLWKTGALHEYDDLDDSATTISFSELRRRVDIDDNGQFNYHLSKLVPHFVRRTDDGYRLSGAGKKIARTVIAISGEGNPDVSDDVTTDCPVCGAPIAATYEDQWLRFTCTECDGLFGDAAPEGTILNSPFPAAGLTDRTPDDALTTGLYRCMLDLTYLMQGICRECAGHVTTSVSVCEDHDTEEGHPCGTCGTPFAVWVESRCETCRFAKRLPVELYALGLTPVIGFLYDREVDVLAPSFEKVVDVLRTRCRSSVTKALFAIAHEPSADLAFPVAERLGKLIGYPDSVVQAWGAGTLGRLAEEHPGAVVATADGLRRLLDHDDNTVQHNAVEAMGALARGRPDAVAPAAVDLRDLLDHEEVAIQHNAAGVLGRLVEDHPDAVVPAVEDLQRLLDHDDEAVRRIAAGALARLARERPEAVSDR